jgi:hypothetical protein
MFLPLLFVTDADVPMNRKETSLSRSAVLFVVLRTH